MMIKPEPVLLMRQGYGEGYPSFWEGKNIKFYKLNIKFSVTIKNLINTIPSDDYLIN